jgi:chromosome segregation protein
VFSAINSATALRHAVEHAAMARDRVAETLTKLDVEIQDVRIESDRVEADRASASERLLQAQATLESTRVARAARESELASARIEHEWRARSVRSREQELAALEARRKSLEELEAARSGYSDGARAVLAQANGKVGQQGAVADYLEVDAGYERAVEACLGDLLQHVVVERPEHAVAGLQRLREENAGRCGFIVTSTADAADAAAAQPTTAGLASSGPTLGDCRQTPPEGVVPLSSIVRVKGPFAAAIGLAVGDAWIAAGYDRAREASRLTAFPVCTLAGDVFRGPNVVSGGGRDEARGILETRREIKELRGRIEIERDDLSRLASETAGLEGVIAQASNAIAALNAEHHRQEKAIVGFDAQLQRAVEETARLIQRGDQLVRERYQGIAERDALDSRQEEARNAIGRLEQEQRSADELFTAAQHCLFGAREAADELSRRATEARAAHATLVERAAALDAEVQRLDESAIELEQRSQALAGELEQIRRRIEELRSAITAGTAQLDADVLALETLQADVQHADDVVTTLRAGTDELEAVVKDARVAHESIRAVVSDLDIARATAESDLGHLSVSCVDAVQATLDEVIAEVEQLERDGTATPDVSAIGSDEPDDSDDDAHGVRLPPALEASAVREGADSGLGRPDLSDPGAAVVAAERHALSAEDAIAVLRGKIERLGPVNMMAIEQFDELETRHAFLTTQRRDLVDSIGQTTEAIKRIDETTRHRFTEAFSAINQNFQQTFSTLFGGGRAGLTLLDENDPLESGIEIIAQPPGKRLQSVQLLSGGEKALTAIALMFGLFQYKPSPFCLLDEIDAPLDDANIGRFVEMLRGMQQHTQFILITHNRKTMEIADRLYGVTMEEPGVSKLISVNVN